MKRYLVFAVSDYSLKGGLDNLIFEVDDVSELGSLFWKDADSGLTAYYPSGAEHIE